MRRLLASLAVVLAFWVVDAWGQDIEFRAIVLTSPSSGDRVTALPTSATTVAVGSTYYVEVWVSDVGTVDTGVSSAYIDLAWPAALASAQTPIGHGSIFTVFPTGTILAGRVDELGGSTMEVAGVEPEWARVAVVPMMASAAGVVAYGLSPSTTGVGARNRGIISWTDIGLLGIEVTQCQGPPQIVQHPAAQSVCPSVTATFTVTANSLFPLEYRWRKDGVPLSDEGPFSGTATSTLSINPAETGTYDVIVSDVCDSMISEAATLSFEDCDDGDPLTIDTCVVDECIHRSADFSGNGRVDQPDRPIFNAAFGSSIGDPAYNPNVDLDANGMIDCADWALFLAHWPTDSPRRPVFIPCVGLRARERGEASEALCGAVGLALPAGVSSLLVVFGVAKSRRSRAGTR